MAVPMVVLLLVPYVPPLLMPTWRWLFAYAVVATVLLTILFHAAMTQPTRTGLEAIAVLEVLCVAISTAAGTLVRTITLFVRPSAVVAINVIGAALPFATLAVFVWVNTSASHF